MANNLTRIKNNQVTDRTLSNVKIALSTLTGDLFNPDLTLNSNVTISGDLTVTGNVTAVQSTSTQITDPLITLGLGNSGTSYDEGFIFTRGGTGNFFLGYKENLDELVFINTTETGLTSGNITTNSYGNVRIGNTVTLGTGVVGLVSMSNGTITTTTGNLTLTSTAGNVNVTGGMSITGNIYAPNMIMQGDIQSGSINNTVIGNVTPASGMFTTLGATSTMSVAGTATVNALVSNGAISGTTGTYTGALSTTSTLTASGTATVNALVSNGAISGTTGTFTGGLVLNTNATVNTNQTTASLFNTTVTTLNVGGAATTVEIGATTGNTNVNNNLIVSGSFSSSSTATVNSLVSNGAISGTTGSFSSTLNASGTATVNALVSNGAISGTTGTFTGNVGTANLAVTGLATVSSTLSVAGATTVNSLASNGAISGTTGSFSSTLNASGTATVNALVSNGAISGTTGTYTGALSTTSTLNASGTATVNALVSNGAISGTTGTFTGNVSAGNLHINGTLTYINSTTMEVVDPIIELNTLANGAALTSDNNYDSGIRTHYYDGSDKSSFFGRVDSTGYLEYFSDVTSETTGVISGTYGTVKSGNMIMTGSGSFGSTLNASGTATVNALVSNGAISGTTGSYTGNIYTSAGNVYAPNGNITASGGWYTGNVTILGNLTASVNLVGNTGTFYGNSQTGAGAIYAGIPSGYSILPNVLAQFTGNANTYVQINAQNINSGSDATTDWVATANNGTDTIYYIDLGIAGSAYDNTSPTNSLGTSLYANDAYLYTQGNTSATAGGNLVVGTSTVGKVVRFISGGVNSANVVATVQNSSFAVNVSTASTNSTNGALIVAGGAGIAGAINGGSTLNVVGAATVNSLTSNGAISGTTGTYTGALSTTSTLNASGTATVNALVSNGAISGTTGTYTGALSTTSTLNASGTATVNALVSNGAVSGTTGTFTSSLTADGAVNFNATTASTSYATGAVIIDGGVGIAGNLNVSGTSYANLANIQVANNTITSISTNGDINVNPNGTGKLVVNSDQDNSAFVVRGTTANANVGNLFVVSTSTNQVGVRQTTFVDGAALQINSTDSMLLPVGAQGDRPSSPVTGMLRFSTTAGSVEWYTGTAWGTASTQFTIVQANTATGDGSTTNFTLPISNASTAGTIVSINGIVQKPVDAYGITGSTLSFTEAPASGDVIDIRAFTTTTTVTSVVDAVGTTGVFLDEVVDDKIITFKNNGVNTASINANGYLNMKANGFIISTPSVTAAATATTIDTFAATSYRAAKYMVTARNSGSTQWTVLEALVVHDGTTATITTYGIVNTGATTQATLSATISGGNVLVQATGAAAGTVVNFEKTYIVGS